jgi:TPP-dependent pyruvate/acetoin dehydrogenase alpha subunit
MAGVGLASRLQKKDYVALTYIGDGGTSTGDFHEGMNLAAVLQVPLVVVAEHNGYAYSTPTARQMKIRDLAQRAAAYGIPAAIADGNDVLAVYETTRSAVERARAGGGPSLVEVKTFRMKGHAEHDDASYVPAGLRAQWEAKDPIARFERHLLEGALATQAELEAIVTSLQRELDDDVAFALESPFPPPERASKVYEPSEVRRERGETTYLEAIRRALRRCA